MSPGLSNAIDGLYAAFHRYAGLPAPVYHEGADPLGFGDSLRSKPLRQLGPTDLARFKWKALTTWGDADDFRHYLPRLLELEASESEVHAGGPETIFSRLDYAGWRSWPLPEQRAIEAFCHAWWTDVTQAHPSAVSPETVLCCIGRLTDDVTPYLYTWHPDRSRGEAMQFAAWVRQLYSTVAMKPAKAGHLSNAWWRRRPSPTSYAIDWLLAPERALELESAFFRFGSNDDTAAALSDASDELYNLRVNAGVEPTPDHP